MRAFAKHVSHTYEFPARTAPAWAGSVERWPQLDAYAYGLPELFHHAQLESRPDLILLASPEASNRTDLAFVKTGAASPAKFVHTLPNSRSAALLQVMAWSGPLLCLQDDPQTVSAALLEAVSFACAEEKLVWLFSVERRDEQVFAAHLFEIRHEEPANTHWQLTRHTSDASEASVQARDIDLFAGLQLPGVSQQIMLFNGLQLTFKDRRRG